MCFSYQKATAIAVAFLMHSALILMSSNALLASDIAPKKAIKTDVDVQDTKQDGKLPKDKNHIIYFSLGDKFNSPLKESQEIFDCTDKIYTVLELNYYPVGKHNLSVRWADPSGTVRERTQYDFNIRNDHTRLWAWLSLSRGFGGGMLQLVNPAAGLEDFIGIWDIDVQINGKTIGKHNFEVSC